MKAGIFTGQIEKVINLGQETRHFHLRLPPETVFDFKAGQFVNFLFDLPGQPKLIKRPYSIASPPCWKGVLDFVWKVVPGGIVTHHLWAMKEGDPIKIQGPLGIFSLREPLPRDIIFISTGTGIAPFRAMIHELLDKDADCNIWNIFGNRYENEILYHEEFELLAQKHSNFKNLFTVSRPKAWKGETQYVQHVLKKNFKDGEGKHIYICGLKAMINEVRDTALAMGFQPDQIFYEKYD